MRTPLPDPIPFKDDLELRQWLGFNESDPGAEKVTRASFPADRLHTFERMRAVVSELDAGRTPVGVIVCKDRSR